MEKNGVMDSYKNMPLPYYSFGIKQVQLTKKQTVLMASMQKALFDKTIATPGVLLRSVKQTLELLIVELGHLLLITTDQHQYIVDYKIMEKQKDATQIKDLQKRLDEKYNDKNISSHSFDIYIIFFIFKEIQQHEIN